MASQQALVPHPELHFSSSSGARGQPVTEPFTIEGGAPRPIARLVRPGRTIIALSATATGSAFLDASGEVLVCGANDEGQLNPDEPAPLLPAPQLLDLLATHRVTALSAAEHHVGVLTANGGLLTFGSNEYLALGHSKDAQPPFRLLPRVPRGLPPATPVLQVSCGATHTLVLSAQGEVYAAGSGARGALGLGDREARGELTRVRGALAGVPIAAVLAADGSSHALSLSGLAYAWGGNRHSQCGLPASAAGHALLAPARVAALPELALAVAAGPNHTLWTSRSGRVYAAGLNRHGQCGLGSPPEGAGAAAGSGSGGGGGSSGGGGGGEEPQPPWCASEPTLVALPGGLRAREVAAGERHTLVLTVSGEVFAMGEFDCGGGSGGGGSGSAPLWAPTRVPSLCHKGVFALAAGGGSSLGIRIVNGSVLSPLPGAALPAGMRVASAAALAAEARRAGERRDFGALRGLMEGVLGHWSSLSGSFMESMAYPLTVETHAPLAAPPAPLAGGGAEGLGGRAGASASASASASSSVMVVDEEGTARGVLLAPSGAAAAAGAPPAGGSGSAEGGAVAQQDAAAAAGEEEGGEGGSDSAAAASSSSSSSSSAPSTPTSPASSSTATSSASAPLSALQQLQPAPALVGAPAPAPAACARSGLDVTGLEAAYGALLAACPPDMLVELVRSGARLLDEVEGGAGCCSEPDALRALLALWLCPLGAKPVLAAPNVARLCRAVLALPQASRDRLVQWALGDVPAAIFVTRLVRPLKECLAHHLRYVQGGDGQGVVYFGSSSGSSGSGSGSSSAGRGAGVGAAPAAGSITHRGAMEGCIRVLRLLYNANERLAGACGEAMDAYLASAAAAAEGGSGGAHAAPPPPPPALPPPSAPLVPADVFYSAEACALSDGALLADYQRWAQAGYRRSAAPGAVTLCAHAFLLDAAAKRRLLQLEAQALMYHAATHAMARSHFAAAESPYLVLRVRRASVVADALNALSALHPSHLRKQLKVEFVGEEGLDAGGVTKDFFQTVLRALLGPESLAGLFTPPEASGGRFLWFTPGVPRECHSDYYLLGLLLGLAVYNSVTCPAEVRFPLALYRLLQGAPLGWGDLAELRPELASGLRALLGERDGEAVEAAYGLTFEADVRVFGEVRSVELVAGGAARSVTGASRGAYAAALSDLHLRRLVAEQCSEFQRGCATVLSTATLHLFSPLELRLLVEGEHELDFGALQGAATYEGGYSASHPCVQAFWRVAAGLEPADRRRLLLFVTGSNQSPIGGLGRLPFKVQRMCPDTEALPTASTCFNLLLLPEYSSEEKLRRKLLTAIRETSGFGLQ